MKQFVAMTDDVLYRSEDLPGPLVPYQCGVFCWHRLREEAAGAEPASAQATPCVAPQPERGALSA